VTTDSVARRPAGIGGTVKPIKRLRKLGRRMRRLLAPPKPAEPVRPAVQVAAVQPAVEVSALRKKYARSPLRLEPDRFVLYRIIGNDLYPRHRLGMSRANVEFILRHEAALADCEKRWIVNRIVDRAEEQAIVDLLERHRQTYLRIPFIEADYERIGWNIACFRDPMFLLSAPDSHERHLMAEARSRHDKNAYVMNNNGARNVALRTGRSVAKWVLPWDGNCFLTASGWAEIRDAVLAQPYLKYFMVPMARSVANTDLLAPGYRPTEFDEPQVLFRRDAREEFDPRYVYGRRPKVSLLWRLGVPGPWDDWENTSWDQPRPTLSPEAHQFATCGWVNRLESGQQALEGYDQAARKDRGVARSIGIVGLLDRLDEQSLRRRLDPAHLMLYRDDRLDQLRSVERGELQQEIVAAVEADATAAIARGTFSVLDKTGCAPSGDRRDYWHPAPYWWPNPDTSDGLPYVQRDGQRRPGTRLYEPGSEEFDRSSLQRVLEGTAVCALAWRATGKQRYADHGAALIRRWFLDAESGMNPRLEFAQARMGAKSTVGNRVGIIEMRDLAILLDGARLLERAGALSEDDRTAFGQWLGRYRDWLVNSPHGHEERNSLNNHGIYYDLQVAAIAAYLGDAALLAATFRRAHVRLHLHFDPDGSQPHELRRTNALHYCAFNLQAWISLAALAARCGEDLWRARSRQDGALERAVEWLIRFEGRDWPYSQLEPFDWARLAPLKAALACQRSGTAPDVPQLYRVAPAHSAYTGIHPYWYL
jgi:hypothetical protein